MFLQDVVFLTELIIAYHFLNIVANFKILWLPLLKLWLGVNKDMHYLRALHKQIL